MRRAAGIALASGLLAVAGCDDDSSSGPPERARPPALGSTVALSGRYPFAGRDRVVRARITARTVTGRVRDPSLAVPKGREPYRVSVRIDDRGRDPFPYRWARFSLDGRGGRVVDAPVQAPLRQLSPGQRGSPRGTLLTFVVPRGFVARELRVESIVKLWPFEGTWRVRAAGG